MAKIKISKIINESCCGSLLPVDYPKIKIVELVEELEIENEYLLKMNKDLCSLRFTIVSVSWLVLLIVFIVN